MGCLRLIYLQRIGEIRLLHIFGARLLMRMHEHHVVINKRLLVSRRAIRSPTIVHYRILRRLVSVIRVLLETHAWILLRRSRHHSMMLLFFHFLETLTSIC